MRDSQHHVPNYQLNNGGHNSSTSYNSALRDIYSKRDYESPPGHRTVSDHIIGHVMLIEVFKGHLISGISSTCTIPPSWLYVFVILDKCRP